MADILAFDRLKTDPGQVPELEHEHPVFVDWLTIRQVHAGGLPIVTGGFVTSVDSDGSIEYEISRRSVVEGSFDSRSSIRCDGNVVEFSGNITRFNRPDNLFGYGFDQTIRLINNLLLNNGLPPFSSGELMKYADSGWVWSGARISRIDITCNYFTGSLMDAERILSRLGQYHSGRLSASVFGDKSTIAWGYSQGSKYVSQKVYIKSNEMRKHQKRASGKHVHNDVITFCDDCGVIREELTLKSRFLTQNNYCYLGSLSQQALIDIYNARSKIKELRNMSKEYQDTSALSSAAMGTYSRWLDGEPHGLSQRTYYRHRREILDTLGVDIGVTKSNVTKLQQPVKVIEIMPLVAPDWYRRRFG